MADKKETETIHDAIEEVEPEDIEQVEPEETGEVEDEEELDLVTMLADLKIKQTVACCKVTKKMNEISPYMTNYDNLHLVKTGFDEYNELYKCYQQAHVELFDNTENVDDQERDHKRFCDNEKNIAKFQDVVRGWIAQTEHFLQENIERLSVTRSRRSSRSSHSSSSHSSSSHSARAREKAKLAALLVEKEQRTLQTQLQMKKQALQAEEDELQLDLEIAKSRAREHVYANIIIDEDNGAKYPDNAVHDVTVSNVEQGVSRLNVIEKQSSTNVTHNVNPLHVAPNMSMLNVGQNAPLPNQSQNVYLQTRTQNVSHPIQNYTRGMLGGIPSVPNVMFTNTSIEPETQPPVSDWRNTTSANTQRTSYTHQHVPPSHVVSQLDPNSASFAPQTNLAQAATQQQSLNVQQQQNEQILAAHRQLATAMTLPQPEVPKFSGDVTEYNTFIMAFDSRIVSRTFNDSDRLYYLEQHLEGEPKDIIGGCLYMEPSMGYLEARSLLHKEYGDPYKVSMAYVNKVLSWNNIKHDDCQSLKTFSIFLTRCLKAMQNISHMSVLNHLSNMVAIVQKLPTYLQNQWRDKANRIRQEHRLVNFNDLTNFVVTASESANDPVFGKVALNARPIRPDGRSASSIGKSTTKMKSTSFATSVDTSSQAAPTPRSGDQYSTKRQCYYCQKSHDLDDCSEFAKKTIDDKRSFLKTKRMCFACYGFNHVSKGCLRKRICKKCSKRHPTALHMDNFQYNDGRNKTFIRDTNTNISSNTEVDGTITTNACYATNANDTTVLQAIIPVKVHQNGNATTIDTYAFYDNGSNGCFLTDDLKQQLQAEGKHTTLQLRTMHGKSTVNAVAVQGLIVTDTNGKNPIELPRSFTREYIPVNHTQIPKPEVLSQWPHLQEITKEMPPYMPGVSIGLLIGCNCPKAIQPLKVVPATGDGPFAVLYQHGWTINGPVHLPYREGHTRLTCNHITVQDVETFKETFSPTSVLKMFEMDFSELYTDKVPGDRGLSREDMLFVSKAKEKIVHINGHYELPLPFRDSEPMPNNKEMAMKRAMWQKKKMIRDEQYRNDYVTFVNNLLSKGFAQRIPDEQLQTPPGKVWYLPHHGVYNPMKPNKIRVVFDCSAKYNGTSLNDHLLQGPDLTNSLVGVLTRFREEPVAFIGDVEAMFHQVRVSPEHHNYLRFLWWTDGKLNNKLDEYFMTVHLFGASSSPSVANFALKRTSDEIEAEYGPFVANTIRHNFYVDDCLKSVANEEVAIKLIHDLKSACQKGGFRLAKFCCNSRAVLETIPPEECTKEIQAHSMDYSDLPVERVLGVQWCVNSDTFGFTITMKNKPSTRRGILSMVSSVYDPLGFVSPFLLHAKKILQDLCREQNLDWDDQVPQDYMDRWNSWLTELPLLEHVTVTRCFKPVDFGDITSCQLHIFSDASLTGYGSVAYLRLCNEECNIHCTFLMGKARLAPLKTTTVPRLELTAALVRMGQLQQRELDIEIDNVISLQQQSQYEWDNFYNVNWISR